MANAGEQALTGFGEDLVAFRGNEDRLLKILDKAQAAEGIEVAGQFQISDYVRDGFVNFHLDAHGNTAMFRLEWRPMGEGWWVCSIRTLEANPSTNHQAHQAWRDFFINSLAQLPGFTLYEARDSSPVPITRTIEPTAPTRAEIRKSAKRANRESRVAARDGYGLMEYLADGVHMVFFGAGAILSAVVGFSAWQSGNTELAGLCGVAFFGCAAIAFFN